MRSPFKHDFVGYGTARRAHFQLIENNAEKRRGRDGDCSPPPAQIPASGITAPGLYEAFRCQDRSRNKAFSPRPGVLAHVRAFQSKFNNGQSASRSRPEAAAGDDPKGQAFTVTQRPLHLVRRQTLNDAVLIRPSLKFLTSLRRRSASTYIRSG